jgi:hypothetical protein
MAVTPVSGLPPRETRTSTGRERDVVVPSPSCPRSLRPQHLTEPVLSNAQVWSPPRVIEPCWDERAEPEGVSFESANTVPDVTATVMSKRNTALASPPT